MLNRGAEERVLLDEHSYKNSAKKKVLPRLWVPENPDTEEQERTAFINQFLRNNSAITNRSFGSIGMEGNEPSEQDAMASIRKIQKIAYGLKGTQYSHPKQYFQKRHGSSADDDISPANESYKKENSPLDNVIDIFSRNRELYGRMSEPTKLGCIEIAKLGKSAWNAWVDKYPLARPSFSSVDFSELDINFSGFRFSLLASNKPCVDFSDAIFSRSMNFNFAIFGPNALFRGSKFLSGGSFKQCKFWDAVFVGCVFIDSCNFDDSEFKGIVDFTDSDFECDASFTSVDFFGDAKFFNSKFKKRAFFPKSEFHMLANFRGELFGERSNFDSANFYGQVWFDGRSIGHDCTFNGATFHFKVSADECKFGDRIIFDFANFIGIVNFDGASFGNDASFHDAIFGNELDKSNEVRFMRVTFGDNAQMSSCIFHSDLDFSGSSFGRQANFTLARFYGVSTFTGSSFNSGTSFERAEFHKDADFSVGSGGLPESKEFQQISFSGASFMRDAIFSGRTFRSTANFDPSIRTDSLRRYLGRNIDYISASVTTSIKGIPKFYDCKLHADMGLSKINLTPHLTTEAARAYRALKEGTEKLKDFNAERKFFDLEMQAEKVSMNIFRQTIFWTYGLISDYGKSLFRPLATFVLLSILFSAMHALLSLDPEQEPPVVSTIEGGKNQKLFRYVLINCVPGLGLDKTQIDLRNSLFEHDETVMTLAIMIEIAHKIVSLTCIFFIGLALRNMFRMKN